MNRILVAIKRVVDYNVRVRVKPDGTGVVTDGVKMSINPFDEIALEEALRIKEKGQAQEVVVVTIGPADCQQQLRTALAMGADRALHVQTDAAIEPLTAARIFKSLIDREQPMLAILGKQAIDDDCNQTGQMLSALWGGRRRPSLRKSKSVTASPPSRVKSTPASKRWKLIFPPVITTDLRLNEPRYVKLPDIMKAKKKPLDVLEPAALGVTPTEQYEGDSLRAATAAQQRRDGQRRPRTRRRPA
jgi:electron transfer flavoprotein beta subunit